MADEPEVTQEAQTKAPVTEPAIVPDKVPETPATDAAPVVEATDDDGEPGGSSPQEIRARKEYRARRGAEKQLESERLERVRLEERLRALEEYRPAAPVAPAEREYTADEVQAGIDAGKVTVAQAAEYFAEIKAKRLQAQAVLEAKAAEPFKKALTEVNEYMALLPWTQDYNSVQFKQVKAVYNRLITEEGEPNNIKTQRLALREVVGSLETLRQRQQVATQTRQARAAGAHNETPAGGSIPRKSDDISHAPADMVRVWDRTGTTPAQRAKEWAHHQKSQAARKAG